MPGGRRNPLSMTTVLQTIEGVVHTATSKTESGLGQFGKGGVELDHTTAFVDLEIQVKCPGVFFFSFVVSCLIEGCLFSQFIGASGLPKMDIVGTADPYFIAKIDNRITLVYVRRIQAHCLTNTRVSKFESHTKY